MYQGRKRKLSRLYSFNYSDQGFYFVTICVKNRIECLGEVKDGTMILNDFGNIVNKCWLDLPNHYSNCKLDEFNIMPNHVHGIIEIREDITVGNAHVRSLQDDRTKMLLSKFIQGFKAAVTKEINKSQDKILFQWQKSFYDHIIRDENDFYRIKKYIQENPIRWQVDRNNPDNLYM
jgi:REP element-mobilizing transposase RayT